MNTQPQSQASMGVAVRVVRCPQCGGQSKYSAQNPYRPFCGERCKMIDLGHWSAEEFRVPANPESTAGEVDF